MNDITKLLAAAKAAGQSIASADSETKNRALALIADSLIKNEEKIIAANNIDMEAARGKLSDAMLDRLALSHKAIVAMAEGIRALIDLPDPCGRVTDVFERPNGLVIQKITVPIGTVAIIYESRPNVTSDAAAICLKSGNACVLKPGSDSINSAIAIVDAIKEGLDCAGIDPNAVTLVASADRSCVKEIIEAVGYVDMVIPRGGGGLIKFCTQNAKVPCVETGTGICHVYVDADADLNMALNVIDNAKTSRVSVCNAEEVCLVHRNVAETFLPMLKDRLTKGRANPVELRCDPAAYEIIGGTKAGERDFDTEFLDYILAVGVVDSADEAIAHINAHSSGHSDAIITANTDTAAKFTQSINSACVYVNASTRFTDGGQFGFGCEMGISTGKIHARGPMGLPEMTVYKYVIKGNGQIR